CGSRCLEGMTFIRAYLWNAGSPWLMLKGNYKRRIRKSITKATKGGGSDRISEGFVMKPE
ncbi:hypothetical protein, partial [Fulvivirga imtechensis]|uniref:hypothetical protein n=1 Tax=Fulvivirga imtechensis TaxID=881893 RepID=UPI001C887853